MPLSHSPRILRGAFIEYGISLPPLMVAFQFNPEELTRSRTLTFGPENSASDESDGGEGGGGGGRQGCRSLRDFHERQDDLNETKERQHVEVKEEDISLDIRLDATDEMAEGGAYATQTGILPRLSTLELMVHPEASSLLGKAVDLVLDAAGAGYSFAKSPNPPLMLFVWGHKRVLPVNITSMSIKETEFSPYLDPIRATVTVQMTVIEGLNPFYLYSKGVKEAASALNLANVADMANVVVPG